MGYPPSCPISKIAGVLQPRVPSPSNVVGLVLACGLLVHTNPRTSGRETHLYRRVTPLRTVRSAPSRSSPIAVARVGTGSAARAPYAVAHDIRSRRARGRAACCPPRLGRAAANPVPPAPLRESFPVQG